MNPNRGYRSPDTPGRLPKVPTEPAVRGVQAIPGIPGPSISDRPADAPPADHDDAPHPDLLTDDEHKAIELAGELWGLLCRIVGHGRSAAADLSEACTHIHALQHAIMAQAAARAYPDRYRLLGGTIASTSEE